MDGRYTLVYFDMEAVAWNVWYILLTVVVKRVQVRP